ncbi:hypothetical protein BO94DRAFT_530654 [Aspergillus sclerotioniger CBS 115572]|uniref:Uncharacterized protein n=1 Tax=Aspergillus sclerotioniger CBS 115572 TaxID=1450535 RepID=A0A317XBA5_9EURO|nr:hypothetical protein BO94DRAFT_530654 [Aspergillus sclerotioniger CBS 115572]PWY95914.1 hypothetical protein BO94DRAFT_530654 [Aspergillus sclerotioniger CBS 115572]
MKSASSITPEQYLSLPVLWKTSKRTTLKLENYDLHAWKLKADEKLKGYSSWNTYLTNFTLDLDSIPESTFAPALYFQRLVSDTSSDGPVPDVTFSPVTSRTRTKTGKLPQKMANLYLQTPTKSTGKDLGTFDEEESADEGTAASAPVAESPGPTEILDQMYKPTKDEEIVTAALSNFLVGLTLHFSISNRWTVHRKPFKADFHHASFEARVDGYLEDRGPAGVAKVRALIEVKPVLRKKKRVRICMQEAAQMVAWLKNSPDPNGTLNYIGRYIFISLVQGKPTDPGSQPSPRVREPP